MNWAIFLDFNIFSWIVNQYIPISKDSLCLASNIGWFKQHFSYEQKNLNCRPFSLDLSLIGIILRWGFLIWELIFIYCGLFSSSWYFLCWFFFFVFFFFFHYVSAKFQLWPSRGDFTATSDTDVAVKSPEEGQRWNLGET